MDQTDQMSAGEEVFNAISHGLGVLAGGAGLAVLIMHARNNGDPNRFWGLLIFGLTMIFMYLASTLYHSLVFTRARRVFKTIDYSAIALFIAGSYTPIALVTLKGGSGWLLLTGVWVLTIAGFLWRIFGIHKDKVSLVLYLITGWLLMVFIKPLALRLPHTTLTFLIAGGLFYSVGTIFFQWRRLTFNHGIWHLCVLAGSMCHFAAMMRV